MSVVNEGWEVFEEECTKEDANVEAVDVGVAEDGDFMVT